MRLLAKKLLEKFGFEVRRIVKSEFEIAGVRYIGNPNSIGEEIYGEPTARGAVEMILERDLRDLRILDVGCGLGVIGLTVYKLLEKENRIREVSFSDINIFNLDALRKTIKANGLSHLLNNTFHIYLSDSLEQIPADQKFDLVLSNPPDWPSKQSFNEDNTPLTPKRLAVFDGNWDFHRSFYAKIGQHLTDRGEVWFLENGSVVKKNNVASFVSSNPDLEYAGERPYKGTVKGSLPGSLFWSIVKKKSPTAVQA